MIVQNFFKWMFAGLAALLVISPCDAEAQTKKRRVIAIQPSESARRAVVVHADQDDKKQIRYVIELEPNTQARRVMILHGDEDDKKQKRRTLRFSPDSEVVFQQTAPSEYWIGVGCGEASAALRAQLGIDDDAGLVVQHVVTDGPAGKAGIEVHDVLIRAAEHTLAGIKDLSEAVNEAEEDELEIELIRGGEVLTIQISPEKRKSESFDVRVLEPDMERTKKWIERFGPLNQPRFNLNFRRPGQAYELDFPDDMNIRIEKKGGESAGVTVEQGDESWEVTEDSLDELPKDVRKYVDSVLGRTPGPNYSWWGPAGAGRTFGFVAPESEEGEEQSGQRSLESLFERLEKQLNERMEKLQERLEDLQKRIPAEPDGGVNAA